MLGNAQSVGSPTGGSGDPFLLIAIVVGVAMEVFEKCLWNLWIEKMVRKNRQCLNTVQEG